MWKDCHGRTALHLACASGHLDIVEYFLSLNNMLLELPDNYGQTALFSAVHFKKTDAIECLLKRDADVTIRYFSLFQPSSFIPLQLTASLFDRDLSGREKRCQSLIRGEAVCLPMISTCPPAAAE